MFVLVDFYILECLKIKKVAQFDYLKIIRRVSEIISFNFLIILYLALPSILSLISFSQHRCEIGVVMKIDE